MTGDLNQVLFLGFHIAFVAIPLILGGLTSVVLLVRFISDQRQGLAD